ncbi:DUF1573 domain-containing protein [Fulvivirgaceae bacterium BMA10]|uniref:DUF1573 domain-containing protein n=1 Tax=Splendidivirga corallicola TaxID=3051826 RepID=A0ABT8KL05_9BACT|nr:DUF1573 domain-containing protein [Fulvivirgaceae bacterium BMA10]
MKNYRIIFFFIFILLSTKVVLSQSKFKFDEMSHDFGEVVNGNIATFDFVFTNIGNEPLIINNVRASCGCTTPYWPKEPILPGGKGKITASYNSKNRPGVFNKSITIRANSANPQHILRIKGIVIPDPDKAPRYSEEQLAISPKFQSLKKEFILGKVENGQVIPFDMEINNPGKSRLVISNMISSCNCIKFDSRSNKLIEPGQSVSLKLLYSPRGKGNVKETITFYSNDLKNPRNSITLIAEVVEDLGDQNMLKEDKPIKF